jgi:hypothetical protein
VVAILLRPGDVLCICGASRLFPCHGLNPPIASGFQSYDAENPNRLSKSDSAVMSLSQGGRSRWHHSQRGVGQSKVFSVRTSNQLQMRQVYPDDFAN